jgi:putative cardiolipin synthase
LLVVDDRSAIVGGRNIADDYFGLAEHYNFVDSDLLVRGEIARAMRETFDLYWHSRFTQQPEPRPARDFLADRPGDGERRARVEPAARERLAAAPAGICRETAFVTDLPGIAAADRRVYPAIARAMAGARTEVVGESPYFVLTGEGAELVRSTVARGVTVSVLTNSLHSTDAFYTVAALWLNLDDVAATGLTLHAFDAHAAPTPPAAPLPETRRGTHAKRAVIDGRDYLIGTYNVDPRSANLNSEMLFICRDGPSIAAAARADIATRSASAAPLAGHGRADHAGLVAGASPGDIARMLAVMPLANLFAFLL